MPDGIAVILLGVIEGVTEFLPVSSTGHLLLAENLHWLPQQSELFNTVIQCGAVLAVLLVFWKRVGELLRGWRQPASRNGLLKLVAAFALTAAGGLVVKKLGWALTRESAPVAWATLIGGCCSSWWKPGSVEGLGTTEVSWPTAIAVGVAQLLAGVFPAPRARAPPSWWRCSSVSLVRRPPSSRSCWAFPRYSRPVPSRSSRRCTTARPPRSTGVTWHRGGRGRGDRVHRGEVAPAVRADPHVRGVRLVPHRARSRDPDLRPLNRARAGSASALRLVHDGTSLAVLGSARPALEPVREVAIEVLAQSDPRAVQA